MSYAQHLGSAVINGNPIDTITQHLDPVPVGARKVNILHNMQGISRQRLPQFLMFQSPT